MASAFKASYVKVAGVGRGSAPITASRPAGRLHALAPNTPSRPNEAYLIAEDDTFSSLAQSLKEAVTSDSTPAPVPEAPPAPIIDAPETPPSFDLPDIYPLGKPAPPPKAADGGSVGDLLGGISKRFSEVVEGAKDGVRGAADSLSQSASQAASGGTDATSGLTSGAADAVSGAVGDLKGAVNESVEAVNAALGGTVDSVRSSLGGAAESITTQLGTSLDSVNAAVNNAVEGATAGATAAASAAAAQVYGALPPPVQDTLRAAGPQLEAAARAAADNPPAAAAVAAAAVAAPLATYYAVRYGGYSGDLSATQTLQLLQAEQAVLVDVRSDERRTTDGVAGLRRGARGKGVAVPPLRVGSGTQRLVRGVSDLEVGATAAVVAGLAAVTPATKVVIMDNKGEVAVKLARALREQGVYRTYALRGGFAAWRADDLPVEQGNANYDVNAIEALTEEAEALLQTTQARIVSTPPLTVAAYGVAAAAVVVALVNYHTTLQFVGVAGSLGLAINWFTNFDTPEEAMADLSARYGKLEKLAKKLPLPSDDKKTTQF